MIVPPVTLGDVISGTGLDVPAAGAGVAVSGAGAVEEFIDVSAAGSASVVFFSFFFLAIVAIKRISAIINNNTPPDINNPGIDKNQSKLKSI